MLTIRAGVAAACVLAVVLAGCGKKGGQSQSEAPKPAAQSPAAPASPAATASKTQVPQAGSPATPAAPTAADYAKMADQNRQNLAQMNGGKVVEAVAPATLKGFLPAELPGLKRTNASAEKTDSMGMNLTTAEGRYNADGSETSVSIKLTDVGNMSGPIRMGMTAWAMAQFNRETDNGYEKTTTYDGYKAYEEYNTQDKNGTLRLWIADRFVVEVEGNGMTMDTLKQMLGKIDLKKLAATGS